jgi:uncharacterized protein YndB with AHSA1/START domain
MTDLQTTLQVARRFSASRERVFRAWTEPQMIEQWFRPMGLTTTVMTLELLVGGAFYFDLNAPTGETGYMAGNYLEIVCPERLAFTWVSNATNDEQTLVTIEFVERNEMTELALTHDRLADEAMILVHQNGWGVCLELMADLLNPT